METPKASTKWYIVYPCLVLRYALFVTVFWPLMLLVLGLNARNIDRLKKVIHESKNTGLILSANHNSHLDTVVLHVLAGIQNIHRIRPVAAADYFLRNRFVAFIALNIIRILPVVRKRTKDNQDPLANAKEALQQGAILIFFPEGSRGEPEVRVHLKKGICHLAARFPHVPVFPIFMHGLGKSLPRHDPVFVPFFVDIFCGTPICWADADCEETSQGRAQFVDLLSKQLDSMEEEAAEARALRWWSEEEEVSVEGIAAVGQFAFGFGLPQKAKEWGRQKVDDLSEWW